MAALATPMENTGDLSIGLNESPYLELAYDKFEFADTSGIVRGPLFRPQREGVLADAKNNFTNGKYGDSLSLGYAVFKVAYAEKDTIVMRDSLCFLKVLAPHSIERSYILSKEGRNREAHELAIRAAHVTSSVGLHSLSGLALEVAAAACKNAAERNTWLVVKSNIEGDTDEALGRLKRSVIMFTRRAELLRKAKSEHLLAPKNIASRRALLKESETAEKNVELLAQIFENAKSIRKHVLNAINARADKTFPGGYDWVSFRYFAAAQSALELRDLFIKMGISDHLDDLAQIALENAISSNVYYDDYAALNKDNDWLVDDIAVMKKRISIFIQQCSDLLARA